MTKEEPIKTRLPEAVVRDLDKIGAIEQADRDTTLRKLLITAIAEWKLAHNAQQYGQGKISMAKAAEQADVTLWEMMTYIREHKIPAQYDRQDLEEDLQNIHKRLH